MAVTAVHTNRYKYRLALGCIHLQSPKVSSTLTAGTEGIIWYMDRRNVLFLWGYSKASSLY